MKASASLPRLIKALLRQPVDRTPIWLMRQAGRYLPEYRALRQKVPDFMKFCHTPELAAEVTLQPLLRFPLDAAILFSDILVVPAAMGLAVEFIKGEGPHFPQPVRNMSDIQKLKTVGVMEQLQPVLKTIGLVKQQLSTDIPLIGFAGSPWTCATYMVEGGSSKQFAVIKKLLYTNPLALHALLERLTQATIEYLNAQIHAGVQVVMLFDTWGGVLSPADYEIFSLDYLKKISQSLIRIKNHVPIPVIFFTKGAGQWLEQIANSGCDAVGLDWTTDIKEARKRIGSKVALQGNLDPCILLSDPGNIAQAAKKICNDFGKGSGHVFNLGHGVLPETPPENVAALIAAVQGMVEC
ncbi:MAG: uroporphyrinogen decarboxylase [Proteobacteria bacterium]|nr:uroporphyrinogen decarboxylase [Pseudomonadota bacterium]